MSDAYEACSQDSLAHQRSKRSSHSGHLVEEVHKTRERAERSADRLERQFDADMRHEQRTLEVKESALQNARDELARMQALLAQRESDLNTLQSALQAQDAESKKLGESHTTAPVHIPARTLRGQLQTAPVARAGPCTPATARTAVDEYTGAGSMDGPARPRICVRVAIRELTASRVQGCILGLNTLSSLPL
ncbi:hypothetical protein EWM64_g6546 [Hericium alpestre]|uniref:GDP/GTP exchange factor Sec2 N-terminal domain-containing protein n=1 Tax=Hericium alpestre TaxID=135208 RepID=A0A4Y9ZTU2_9AGAM|nr:hypothetical protein EWM64_g6546 [Hericium alpestre]